MLDLHIDHSVHVRELRISVSLVRSQEEIEWRDGVHKVFAQTNNTKSLYPTIRQPEADSQLCYIVSIEEEGR